MTSHAETVTILFTDLVGSTELLQRSGDDRAQRVFKAHHRLLSEAVRAHGGQEVKWLGDGLMVAFDSAIDAARCAVAMQQAARRPAAGELLQIRVGLNVGEAIRDETDYFGMPVVVARRLCDQASAGQIFASDVVARLLDDRADQFTIRDLGTVDLKGIAAPTRLVEMLYEHDPMELLRRTPFVGRREELAALDAKLAEVRGGSSRIVLLSGEPGIGKSRLAEEFCEHAETSGALVARGNCYEGDASAPYRPWVETLRSFVQRPDDDLRRLMGAGAPEILTLLPELKSHFPDVEPAPRLDEPEAERLRLFDSVAAFVRNAAAERPVVLLLDDLHWADKPSLLLLQHIARNVASTRLQVIGAYRDVELDRKHPLAEALAALRRLDNASRVQLHGLSSDTVEELLGAVEPSAESEGDRGALAAALHRETEGNPFFIKEVLTHLIETGKISRQDGRWAGQVASIADLGIPEGVREVVGRRLERLSAPCNQMLTRASLMTGGFSWGELSAICGDELSEEQLLDALDEALAAQLVSERPTAPGLYDFTHALVRQTLYDELNTPRRVLLHRKVGQTLEALYADDLDAHLAVLAHHFLSAAPGGDADKAVEYSRRAGERAQGLLAFEDAVAHYQRALQALEFARDDIAPRRVHILLALFEAQTRAGAFLDADESARKAVELTRGLPDALLFARAASAFGRAGINIDQLDSRIGNARTPVLREALDRLGGQDDRLRAELLVRLSGADATDRSEERRVLTAESLEIARRVGDARTAAWALLELGLWDVANVPAMLATADEIGQLAERSGDFYASYTARVLRYDGLLALGDMRALDAEGEVMSQIAEAMRSRTSVRDGQRAMRALLSGDFPEAELHMQSVLRTGQDTGSQTIVNSYGAQLLVLRAMQGRLPEMEGPLRGLVERYPDVDSYSHAFALACCHAGRPEEVRATFGNLAAREVGFGVERNTLSAVALFLLAELCFILEDREEAERLRERLWPYRDIYLTLLFSLCLGSTQRSLGLLSETLGRFDEAAAHYERAIEMDTRIESPPWVAHGQRDYGRLLLRRDAPGDRDHAALLLRQALRTAREIGLGKVAADCELLLAKVK